MRSTLNPETRSRANTSRSTAVSMDTRCSSLATRSRSCVSASLSSSSVTTSPSPRRIQLKAVAWDLKLWKEIGIIGGDNLGLDSMVVAASFTLRHRALPATPDRLVWVISRWKKSQSLRDVQLHRSGSKMSNDAAGTFLSSKNVVGYDEREWCAHHNRPQYRHVRWSRRTREVRYNAGAVQAVIQTRVRASFWKDGGHEKRLM